MRPSRNDNLVKALATEVKVRRNEIGLTQEALAASIDLDRPYLTLIEAARKQPTISVLWRLAVGLQMSASELMRRVEQRYAQADPSPTDPIRPSESRQDRI